jgi:hypothetical protein
VEYRANFVIIRGEAAAFAHEWPGPESLLDLVEGPEGMEASSTGFDRLDRLSPTASLDAACLLDFDRRRCIVYVRVRPLDAPIDDSLDDDEAGAVELLEYDPEKFFRHPRIRDQWDGWTIEVHPAGTARFASWLRERGLPALAPDDWVATEDDAKLLFTA